MINELERRINNVLAVQAAAGRELTRDEVRAALRSGTRPPGMLVAQRYVASLDAATREATAFAGWGMFVAACIQGYVPTLPPDQGESVRRLRSALAAADLPIWPEATAADRPLDYPIAEDPRR
jgi:hypothetical protein